jgi:uncharacterized membrane protein YpjA
MRHIAQFICRIRSGKIRLILLSHMLINSHCKFLVTNILYCSFVFNMHAHLGMTLIWLQQSE